MDRRIATTWPLPTNSATATPAPLQGGNAKPPSTASTTTGRPTLLDSDISASAGDWAARQPASISLQPSSSLLPRHLCILAWSLAVLRPASPTLHNLLRTAAHVASTARVGAPTTPAAPGAGGSAGAYSSGGTAAGGQAVRAVPLPYHVYGLSQLFLANYAASLAEAVCGVEAVAAGELMHEQHAGPGPGAEGACCAPQAAVTHAGRAAQDMMGHDGVRSVNVGAEGGLVQGAVALARTAAAALRWRRRQRGSEPASRRDGRDGGGGGQDSGLALSGSFTVAAEPAERRARGQEQEVEVEEQEAGFGPLWEHRPELFAAAADAWVETTRGTIRSALQGAVVGELRGGQGAGGPGQCAAEGTGVEANGTEARFLGRVGEVVVDVGVEGSGRMCVRVEVEAVGEEVWLPGWVFGVDVLCRVRVVWLGAGGAGTEGLAARAGAGISNKRGARAGQVGRGRGGGVAREDEGEVWLVGIQVDGPSHFVVGATEGGTGATAAPQPAREEVLRGGGSLGGRDAELVALLAVVGETALRDWCCALALGAVEGAQRGQQGQGLYSHVAPPPLPSGVLAVRRHPDPWVVACLAEQLQRPVGQEGQWTRGAQPCISTAGVATHMRAAGADGDGGGGGDGGGVQARRRQEGRVAGLALVRVSHADWRWAGEEGEVQGERERERGRWSGCLLPLLARACTCR